MADVDVIIVNYHSAALVHNCVRSVRDGARTDGVTVNIAVVNNSTDGMALASAVERAGGAAIIQNEANVGFGRACNIGARHGTAAIILFLNPDAMLMPGCLGAVVGFLEDPANRAVGIVGPELVDTAGAVIPSCSNLPSAGSLIGRTLGVHLMFPGLAAPYLPPAAHEASRDVGQVMGAVMFVRRDLFAALGGFDERFFLYYDDVDLSARALAAGSRSHYLKSARASHDGAGSTSRVSGEALALHVMSRASYAGKHHGALARAVVLIASLLVEFPLRAMRAVVAGHGISAVGTGYAAVFEHVFRRRTAHDLGSSLS